MKTRFLLILFLFFVGSSAARAQSADEVKKLLAQLKDKDISDRQAALRELMNLGPKSKDAVPVLIDAFRDKDPEVRQIVTNILGKIGKAAVPELIAALKDDAQVMRRQACIALAKIGADGAAALKPLGATVQNDKDKEVRSFAVAALVKIDPEGQTAHPFLSEALKKDPDKDVRLAVLFALEESVAKAETTVVPLIASGLRDEDKKVRITAAAVLGRVGAPAKLAAGALADALKNDKDGEVRASVALVMVDIDKDNLNVVLPVLLDSLKDANADARRSAVYVLGQLGPAAKMALPALTALSKDDASAEVRQAATVALEKIRAKD